MVYHSREQSSPTSSKQPQPGLSIVDKRLDDENSVPPPMRHETRGTGARDQESGRSEQSKRDKKPVVPDSGGTKDPAPDKE